MLQSTVAGHEAAGCQLSVICNLHTEQPMRSHRTIGSDWAPRAGDSAPAARVLVQALEQGARLLGCALHGGRCLLLVLICHVAPIACSVQECIDV